MNNKMDEQLMKILILIACFLSCTDSYSKSYLFPHCSHSTYDIDEDKIAYMTYTGSFVSIYCDQMSFRGQDDGNLNEYKLCITPIYFKDPNCAIKLEYKEKYDAAFPLKTFSCSNIPTKEFCTGDDRNAEFELKIDTSKSYSNAQFKFKITAEMTYNYGAVIGGIVGGVLGGIALICLVVGIVVCQKCKRKRSVGTVHATAGTAAVSQFNTTGSYFQPTSGTNYPQQYSTGYSQYYSPSTYPSSQFQHPASYMAAPLQFQQPVTATAPSPPPYEEVTSKK